MSLTPQPQEQARRTDIFVNDRGRARKADSKVIVTQDSHPHKTVETHIAGVCSRSNGIKLNELVGLGDIIVNDGKG